VIIWILAVCRQEIGFRSPHERNLKPIISEAKLTPRQIEIIELKFIHDLKNYQIAMKIDTSVQTVERDLQQAYNSVKRALKAVT
jgi:predicted DNA-binding protein (UPF0251 family)